MSHGRIPDVACPNSSSASTEGRIESAPSGLPAPERAVSAASLGGPAAGPRAVSAPTPGAPLPRRRGLPRGRRARRLRPSTPRPGRRCLPPFRAGPLLIFLPAAGARFFAPAGHRVLGRPGPTLRFLLRDAPALVALFDVLRLTLLFRGVGGLVASRHGSVSHLSSRENIDRRSRPCGGAHDHV